VLTFVPTEERVQYSAMTGQALFYMAETNLKHRVLAVVEEEGAERASYALKLLQSEGELTIASTGKDPETGKLVTHEYRVEGPVMIMLTTTAVELDEELVNRALVLTVDEDRDQTRAIHQRQRARRTLDGRLASVAKAELLALHRNAHRLIEPVTIVNPYAPQLTFVDARTRAQRDHEKYLTLIDVVALLHQHQRERKTVTLGAQSLTYIKVTREDIAVANRLAVAVLGPRSMSCRRIRGASSHNSTGEEPKVRAGPALGRTLPRDPSSEAPPASPGWRRVRSPHAPRADILAPRWPRPSAPTGLPNNRSATRTCYTMPNQAYSTMLLPDAEPLKPVEWMGASREDLRALPEEPRRVFGFALHQAQRGGHHRAAKRLTGELAGLIEVVDDFDGETYRAVYTVKLAGVVYVLHVFQKKSTRGIALPKHELTTIRERWQHAKRHHSAHYHEGGK
jgi:phage-related protein